MQLLQPERMRDEMLPREVRTQPTDINQQLISHSQIALAEALRVHAQLVVVELAGAAVLDIVVDFGQHAVGRLEDK